MPVYVYDAIDEKKGCEHCRKGFEVTQHINDPKLTACPVCGAAIQRVIQAPGLTHSKTDLHYRAKRAGFRCLKRIGKGEYEKQY